MKKPKKVSLIVIIALILLSGGAVTYTHIVNNAEDRKLRTDTAEQRAQDSQKKAESLDTSKSVDQGTYTPPTDASGIELSASQINASQVVVSTKLTGYSDGTCALTTANGAVTNAQNVQVIYQPSFSTCAGFTIPVSDLGVGTWTFTLSVTSGGITNQKTNTLTVK